ncbi:hypothetical protein ACWDZ4_33695 [Streptomyces sp. NPDC003016]
MRKHTTVVGAMAALTLAPLLLAGPDATAAAAAPGAAARQALVDCPSDDCQMAAEGVSAWGVALDEPAGKLYVGDELADKLWEVDLGSGRKTAVADYMDAHGVALDGAGSAYVAHLWHEALWRIGLEDGRKSGMVAQYLGAPTDVALDGQGHAYVTDVKGDRLWEINLSSGEKREVATGLGDPQSVALDGQGHAYVTDSAAHKLWEVDLAGGSKTEIAGDLGDAMGVALDGDRNAYVADSLNNRVWRVDLDRGSKRTVVAGVSDPREVVISSQGHLYIGDTGRKAVWRVTGLEVTPPGRPQPELKAIPHIKAVAGGIATPRVTVRNTGSAPIGNADLTLTLGPAGVSWPDRPQVHVTGPDNRKQWTPCTVNPRNETEAVCKDVPLSLKPGRSTELETRVRTSPSLRPGEMPGVHFRIGEKSAYADFLIVRR